MAASIATPLGGGTAAQVALEPEPDGVYALSTDLEVIYFFSRVPSPEYPLFSSNPPSRQQIEEERSDYDYFRGVHQRTVVQRLLRGGGNTRLVARLMTAAADGSTMPTRRCPRLNTVRCRSAASTPFDRDQVRDMHTILEQVLRSHPDGYASDLPGLRRQFRNIIAATSGHSAPPDSPLAGPSRLYLFRLYLVCVSAPVLFHPFVKYFSCVLCSTSPLRQIVSYHVDCSSYACQCPSLSELL